MHIQAGRLVAALVAAVLVAACSGDDEPDEPPADPQAQLDAAATILDETSGVRFTVNGEDLPDSGTVVVSAEGVAAPPASFEGEVRITTGGLGATVNVVSLDGQLWAQLPFTSEFTLVDADALGFGDPGTLIDPNQGVSNLLKSGSQVTASDQVRVDGEVLDQIDAILPGSLVGSVLTIADPEADVHARWSVEPESGQLRRAVLTGPFYESEEQTYTVELHDYDERVEIRAPSG
jgi:hypothetical protein